MLVKDKTGQREHRAILSDLGKSACVAYDSDHALSCEQLAKSAPAEGADPPAQLDPQHHNVRQVGLLFSRMVLGTETPAAEGEGGVAEPGARPRLEEAPTFKALEAKHPDIAALLSGILELDPSERLTQEQAMKKVDAAMSRRAIRKPMDIVVVQEVGDRLRAWAPPDPVDLGSSLDSQGTLRLRLEGMGDEGADSLMSSLHRIGGVKRLELSVEGNGLTDRGAEAIAQAIDELHELEHLVLDLEDNAITDQGASKIALALYSSDRLRNLDIDLERNSITDEGAAFLTTAISKNLWGLELELGGNSVTDKGLQDIAKSVAKATRLGRLELELDGSGISDTGVRALSASLSKLTELTALELDLRNNKVANVGATSLAEAIMKSETLRTAELDLGGNNIGEEGAEALDKAKKWLARSRSSTDLAEEMAGAEVWGAASIAW